MSHIVVPLTNIASLRDRDPLEQAVVGFLLRLSNRNTYREYERDLKDFLGWCAAQELPPLTVRRVELTAYPHALQAAGRAEATACPGSSARSAVGFATARTRN